MASLSETTGEASCVLVHNTITRTAVYRQQEIQLVSNLPSVLQEKVRDVYVHKSSGQDNIVATTLSI
ncbi:hypothetical protein KQX54_005228 [Cotesia glomerata]|uniref:Uncharacterized protein n=1 Tax=Cotesia glomerata TaxID=32391 RepID=A0AAV7I5G9_COTGL|nr:hypothetical protein KQX54_005228 [Cotesia glomerata]